MSKIQAVVVDPSVAGRLVLKQVDPPQPTPDQALIRVAAISLNRGEVRRSTTAAAGWQPGWDLAGVIEGKKVAFQKGSSANYLIVQVLKKAGLQFSDIQPVYLAPADARAAFVQRRVDAWVIWDPFYAAAENGANARTLINGEGINSQGGYYISSRRFATENAKILKPILEEIRDLETWSDQHRDEVATVLASALKLDLAAVKIATQRRQFGLKPINDNLIAEQQKVADTYADLKLIPKKINIKEATLKPEEYAAFAIQ